MKHLINSHGIRVYMAFLIAGLLGCSAYLFMVLASTLEPGSIIPSYAIAAALALIGAQVLWGPLLRYLERVATPPFLVPLLLAVVTTGFAVIGCALELTLLHSAAVSILLGIFCTAVGFTGGIILPLFPGGASSRRGTAAD
jgi:hypothetical protein